MLGRYDPVGKLDVPVFKGVMGDDAEATSCIRAMVQDRQGLVMLSEIESGLPHSTKKDFEVDISDPET
jgi:hypothetical protein